MAIIGNCPSCNTPLTLPEGYEYATCGNCGVQFRMADVTVASQVPLAQPLDYDPQYGAYVAPQQPAANSLLANWQTSVGWSIAGVVVYLVWNYLAEFLMQEGVGLGVLAVLAVISLAFAVAAIVYALSYYPSFFGDSPKVTGNAKVSFLNLFFGGIIFGCIWNSNLTKRTKGYSNIVYVCLMAVFFVLYLVLAFVQ